MRAHSPETGRGELTQDDVDRINTRLVGRNGVALPKVLEGDSCFVCNTNSERNAVTAGIFREHLQATHHDAGSESPSKAQKGSLNHLQGRRRKWIKYCTKE